MTRAGVRALFLASIGVLAAAGLGIAALHRGPSAPPKAATQRLKLMLLTSLPLILSEDFSLKSSGSPALQRLETSYRVVPISVTSPNELTKGQLLLMAQPQAQTPENLVALDDWVRGGGRVLLLADPMLEWPSERPLGDPLRPPPMFADTGLLAHWGLRLDTPDQRGPAPRKLAGYEILTGSPGALYGSCAISEDRLVADCKVGRGWAAVVADADLLNVEALGPDSRNNLKAIVEELASLKNR